MGRIKDANSDLGFMNLGLLKSEDKKIYHHLKRKHVSARYVIREALRKWIKEMDKEEQET